MESIKGYPFLQYSYLLNMEYVRFWKIWKIYANSLDPLHDMVLDSNSRNATDDTTIARVNSLNTSSDVKKMKKTTFFQYF